MIHTIDCKFHRWTKLPIPAGTPLSFVYDANFNGQISRRGRREDMNAVAKEELTSLEVRVVSDGQKREVFNRP